MSRPGQIKEINGLGKDIGYLNGYRYSWVAVAFSADQRLGRDLVFPCTNAPDGKNVRIYLIGTYEIFLAALICPSHIPKMKH